MGAVNAAVPESIRKVAAAETPLTSLTLSVANVCDRIALCNIWGKHAGAQVRQYFFQYMAAVGSQGEKMTPSVASQSQLCELESSMLVFCINTWTLKIGSNQPIARPSSSPLCKASNSVILN